MLLYRIRIAAVFRKSKTRAPPVLLLTDEVIVKALDVPRSLIVPAARVVDLPRQIESAHHFCHLPGIKLSPSLVEQNPERHARCIVKLMNRLAALPLPPLSSRF